MLLRDIVIFTFLLVRTALLVIRKVLITIWDVVSEISEEGRIVISIFVFIAILVGATILLNSYHAQNSPPFDAHLAAEQCWRWLTWENRNIRVEDCVALDAYVETLRQQESNK